MSLIVHGSKELLLQFRGLVRTELGDDLRILFNMGEDSPAEARLNYLRELGHDPRGSLVQVKFYGFLAHVIRDKMVNVEIEIRDNEHPPLFGSWWGPRQVLDIADINAIPAGNLAYSRTGVLVHEIAERFWLVMMGFQYSSGMREDDYLRSWFAPAHAYALTKEAEVTGYIRESESGRTPIAKSEYMRFMFDDVPALVDAFSPMPGPSMETTMEMSYREYRPSAGTLYPARRRVTVRAAPIGPPRVEEVPINPRKPGSTGR
jgi:hypothetical protein